MKASRLLIGAAALALSVAATAAPTITVTWDNPIVQPNGINPGTITSPDGSVNANAGRFVGEATAWTDIDPASFYSSSADFYAYCHDLAQRITNGATATYEVSFGANAGILNFLGAVNAYFGGDRYRWLAPENSTEAGVIQLGIWEGLHGDDFNLASGSVHFSNVSAAVSTLFDNIVAQMNTSPDLGSQYVMVLTSGRVQDVITGYGRPQQVPEPGTLLLLGLAGVAAELMRRRR